MTKEYQPLVQKYRPRRFSELVGQMQVVSLLQSAYQKGSIAPAYLFSGPHGVGKTSTARVFAKLINCLRPEGCEPCNQCEICQEINAGRSLDVIEIDAASNRRIDEIRQLREAVKFAPVKSRYKVYIIDEVHMLTLEAFNALLKTLEEPPDHVKFILATTHPHKLPPTVLSRCQRVEFTRASDSAIRDYIEQIARGEGIEIEPDLVDFVVQRAHGSLRDAGALLEQIIVVKQSSDITEQELIELLSVGDREGLFKEVVLALVDSDVEQLVRLVDKILKEGVDLGTLMDYLENTYRAVLLALEGVQQELWSVSEDQQELVNSLKDRLDEFELFYILQILIKMRSWIKTGVLDRLALELGFIKIARRASFRSVADSLKMKDIPLTGDKERPRRSEPVVSVRTTPSISPQRQPVQRIRRIIPDFWRKVLVELMRERKMLLAHILQDVWSVNVNGDVLEIMFSQKFSFESMKDQQHVSNLREVLKRLLGKEFKFRFSLLPKNKENKEEDKDPVLEEKIDLILKTFGGKVIERGKLKEENGFVS